MMMKKIFITFSILIVTLSFGINHVLADCEDCDASNCGDCGCVLSRDGKTCAYSNYDSEDTSCGNGYVDGIPSIVPKLTSIGYTIIQIAVPVLLVVMGSIDLMKGLTAQKEDEIKKGQQLFIKRLISAVLVFFVFIVVKFFISVVADESSNKILECTQCFLENECD